MQGKHGAQIGHIFVGKGFSTHIFLNEMHIYALLCFKGFLRGRAMEEEWEEEEEDEEDDDEE